MKLISPTGKHLSDLQREATYTHHQDVASTTWTVNHSLYRRPSVTTVDISGGEIYGTVSYSSDTQLVITFSVPIVGKAYLN